MQNQKMTNDVIVHRNLFVGFGASSLVNSFAYACRCKKAAYKSNKPWNRVEHALLCAGLHWIINGSQIARLPRARMRAAGSFLIHGRKVKQRFFIFIPKQLETGKRRAFAMFVFCRWFMYFSSSVTAKPIKSQLVLFKHIFMLRSFCFERKLSIFQQREYAAIR